MNKITDNDLANRGVKGLPDVPGLTTEEMQRKLEEIAREILVPKVNEIIDNLIAVNSNLSTVNTYIGEGRLKTDAEEIVVTNKTASEWKPLKASDFILPDGTSLSNNLTVATGNISDDGTIFWNRYGKIVVVTILNCIPNSVNQITPAPAPTNVFYSAIMSTDLSSSIWKIDYDGYVYKALGEGSKSYTGQIVYICR